jgi:parallel beta-helix repeat protein
LDKRITALTLCTIVIASIVLIIVLSENAPTEAMPNTSPSNPTVSEPIQNSDNSPKNNDEPNITVPDNYPNITEAVNNAKDGDTIFVRNGTYIESITITKSLTLKGENKANTIVDANNLGPAFLVKSENVTITGFKVRNIENPGEVTGNNYPGIHLLGASHCYVYDNIVVKCGKGVWIYGGSNNCVTENLVVGNGCGVLLQSTTQNEIANNTAENGIKGIFVVNSQSNTLKDNVMQGNQYNFGLYGDTVPAYQNLIDTSNTVDGKKVYCLSGLNDQIISPQTYPDIGSLTIADSKNINIQGVSIKNNNFGIHLFEVENAQISNCSLENNEYGFYLVKCSNCVISDNSFFKISENGIRVLASEEISISKNLLQQTGSVTVNIENSSECTVEENTFYGYHTLGLCLDSSNNNKIFNNTQSGEGIVELVFRVKSSSGNRFESNDFSHCALSFLINTGSNNNMIIGNSFATDGGWTGLSLDSAEYNTISDNVWYNFRVGFELANAGNNVIARNIVTSKDHAIQYFNFNNNVFDSNQFLGSTDVWDNGLESGRGASVNTWK